MGELRPKGMHCRSYEYEAGRDEMGIETNGGAVGRKPGPGGGCSAIRGRTDGRRFVPVSYLSTVVALCCEGLTQYAHWRPRCQDRRCQVTPLN